MATRAAGLRSKESDGEALTETARSRLAALIAQAARSHFWSGRLREAGIDPDRIRPIDAFGALRRIEPVSARELRLAGGGALRDGWVRPWWRRSAHAVPGLEPLPLWYDLGAWLLLSHQVRARAHLASGVAPHDRLAVLAPVAPGREGWTAREILRPHQRISTRQAPETIARKLVLHHPKAIVGAPADLFVAARALRAAGWRLPLRAVLASGDQLSPSARRALGELFGAPVRDIYGGGEPLDVAWTCSAGGHHLNADMLQVEALGPDGAALPTGDVGELAVTVLVNHAMPLLRYRTGDRGRLIAERCACGSPFPLVDVLPRPEVRRAPERRAIAEGRTAASGIPRSMYERPRTEAGGRGTPRRADR